MNPALSWLARLGILLWMLLAGPLLVAYWILFLALSFVTLRVVWAHSEFVDVMYECPDEFRMCGRRYVEAWRELFESEPRWEV